MRGETLKNNIINIAKIKQLLKKLNFGGDKQANLHILEAETSLAKLQLLLLNEKKEKKEKNGKVL